LQHLTIVVAHGFTNFDDATHVFASDLRLPDGYAGPF
jgi:hypothetical protein